MWEEKGFLWMETGEGISGDMELRVRTVGRLDPAGREPELICLKLTGPEGYCLEQEAAAQDGEAVFACPGVKLWDPEHPRLYLARADVKCEGEVSHRCEQEIGFRVLERQGRQLLWNHRPLKLKGVCYRERKEDWEGTVRDLELFAQANINFLRSIYGPFSSPMLKLCDEMGFLVENTAPFYEVGQTKTAIQDLPHCREDFLEAAGKMLDNGSHVSVLIWSLGHDCAWGANFREAARLLRSVDSVRPLTFHLPMSIPEEDTKIDVWPMHYIDWQQPFDVCFDQMVIFHTPGEENEIGYMTARQELEVPVLHEVWSPAACHNRDEILHDGAVRKFWGESISRFAAKSYETPGCLGGAVLAGVDEDGSFEDMGQYEWGILDRNHNPKPEYLFLKKAYAPAALRLCREDGGLFRVEIQNRFLYTNLSECRLSVDGTVREEILLQGQPGSVTSYEFTGEPAAGQAMSVAVVSGDGSRRYGQCVWEQEKDVMEENGRTGAALAGAENAKDNGPEGDLVIGWTEDDTLLSVGNRMYQFLFSRESCLLERGSACGKLILAGGPYLNCTGLLTGKWTGKKLSARYVGKQVQVTIEGSYENVLDIRFLLLISKDGTLDTSYEVLELFRHMPHTVKAEIGMCPGGLNEKGAAYLLADGVKQLAWTGAERGSAPVSSEGIWCSVHHITSARLTDDLGRGVMVLSEAGRDSVRLEKAPQLTPKAVVNDRDERMRFEGSWHQMDDYCGNYQGTETLSREAGDTMKLVFTGTGVRLYGPLDINYGCCDIYLDGQILAENVSQYLDKADFPGVSRGYEKRYGLLLFEAHDLPKGEHELMVRVAGTARPGAQNTYTAIDYAVIESDDYPVGIRLNVNQDYNYTRLVRGCYKRPKVELIPGVRERFCMKLLSGRE